MNYSHLIEQMKDNKVTPQAINTAVETTFENGITAKYLVPYMAYATQLPISVKKKATPTEISNFLHEDADFKDMSVEENDIITANLLAVLVAYGIVIRDEDDLYSISPKMEKYFEGTKSAWNAYLELQKKKKSGQEPADD